MNEDDDERALEDLFNAHSKWLYATAFSIVKDQGLAEEIVEDVFFLNFGKIGTNIPH